VSPPVPANVDIYIAKFTDGGETLLPANVLRLTDAMLGDPEGADQFMPAIAVDQWGGINILYYRTTDPDNTPSDQTYLRAMYARIHSFSGTSPSLTVKALSPSSFRSVVPPMPTEAPFATVGDYQWICVSACSVYACYMSTLDFGLGVERYSIYVQKVTLCAADADTDGSITPNDPIAFSTLYAACDPRADLNNDGCVDAYDFSLFLTAYTCGSNP
jgi:hypothetical protein